jgi:hypothetical protein
MATKNKKAVKQKPRLKAKPAEDINDDVNNGGEENGGNDDDNDQDDERQAWERGEYIECEKGESETPTFEKSYGSED